MKVIKEIDHPARTVREVPLFVRQSVWMDGASSFDVYLPDGRCLTPDNAFDHMPSDEEIEKLPYIAPSIGEEDEGMFWIYSASFRQGPYPSRADARKDIRAGKW